MAFLLRHLIRLPLLALVVTAATADSRPAAPVAPVEFTVFARHRHNDLQFLPDAHGAPQSLEFFGKTRSPRYTHHGGPRLPFYSATELTAWQVARTASPDKPPPLPAPVAIADIPAGLTRALLLFTPAHNPAPGEPRLHIHVVDDNPRTLPAGHIAVINISGRDYKARIGGQLLEVPLGNSGKIPAKGTVGLHLATQTEDDNRWVFAGRHTFRLNERERASLVFFPPASPTGIAPIIRTLVETPPTETPAQLAGR